MKTAIAAALLALVGGTHAQTILYDTFNEAEQDNLFDCCNALTFGGQRRAQTRARLPFTVPGPKTHIIEIDIPVAFVEGESNGVSINLSGLHGHKHSFKLTGLDSGGQCCAYRSVEGNVAVTPGVQYEIQLKADRKSSDSWNLNSAGITGDYSLSFDNGKTWTPETGTLPALRIIGQ